MLWYLINIFLNAFVCVPRKKLWMPTVPEHCMDWNAIDLISVIFNIVSDMFIFLLPISSVLNLQMAWKRKLGVSAIFATSAL